MAFFPIALTTPQYFDSSGDPASGFVLKAYKAGTSTNISMATDSTGNTAATSMALNANGYPEVSGTIVIPHLDQDYKLSLYPTQAAADANTGATWAIDNLSNTLFFNLAQLGSVAGTNTVTATSSPTIGSYVVDDLFIFSPANANTGAVTLNIDSEGAGAVQLNGAALASGELQPSVPVIVQVSAVTPVFEIVANGNMMSKSGGAFTGTITHKQGSDVASAAALPVDVSGNLFDVTGTVTVTSLKSKGVGTVITLQFDGALILTHHATNLILPGAANITTAAGDIATFYEYASADWRCVSYQRAKQQPGQHVVQVVNTSTGTVATGTTAIPSDNTIPQNTEGDEYMTLAITPKSTSNFLVIEVVCQVSNSNLSVTIGAALFQDSTAGALKAVQQSSNNSVTGMMHNLVFRHYMTAGTVSATTFKVRAGGTTGATTTFNGSSGVQVYGGVMASSIAITEYAA